MRKEIFDQFTLVGISSDGKCIEFLKGKEFLNYLPEYEIMMVLDEENSVNKKVIPIKNSDDIKIPEWVDKAIASYLDKGWGFQRDLPDGVFWWIPESEPAGVLFLGNEKFNVEPIKQSRKSLKRDRKSNKYNHETR